MRYLLADKGYDADRLRRSLRDVGAVPAIPWSPQPQAHHPLHSRATVDATSSRSLSAAHALMAKAAKRAKTDTEMLVVAGYRMGTITSFPLREPVLSSSTTAEIASDSGTMRPIAGTSWPRSWASAMLAMHCVVGLPNTR